MEIFCPWNFPGKSTKVGCQFFFQGIFTTWVSNLCLPHCRQTLPSELPGKPARFIENSTIYLKLFWDWRVEWACCVFLQVGCCNYTGFTRGNDCFWTSYANSRFTKDISLQFQSCVNAFLGQKVLSMNVDFCSSLYPDQQKLYCQRTSHQEMASSIFLSEIQILDDTWGTKVGKNSPVCSSVLLEIASISGSFFLFRPQVIVSEKHFPTASELYKDTPRTHCTIPLEESSGKHVLWELLPYLLLPWEGDITLPGDCSMNKQALASAFRKHRYLSKAAS